MFLPRGMAGFPVSQGAVSVTPSTERPPCTTCTSLCFSLSSLTPEQTFEVVLLLFHL